MRKCLIAAFFFFGNVAFGDSISFGGSIYQPNANPPAANSSLDSIGIGDPYTVALDLTGAISGAGTYTNFTGITFSDSTAGASETAFDLSDTSLTVTNDGSFFDFSLLGCLTSGSACSQGNQLDAEFKILKTNVNSASAAAQSIPSLTPMDLLEDDGLTDIQGTVTSYSYTAATPEPAFGVLVLVPFVLIGGALLRRRVLLLASSSNKSRSRT